MPVALELLAPAKNKDIGIAAIDCGADAVYIAGPAFGAREAAGNSIDDIAGLTEYAHKFGVKVFLTLNTLIYEHELEAARKTVFQAAEAGCDALIVQDLGLLRMSIPPIELHASTQCNIRTVEQARWLASLGFKRLVLARELSLEQIREIAGAVPECGIECFVHGALCVSYSGQCYLSQYLTGRSANRGCCIQACRSRYDLTDTDGHVLLKDKAILSLKDLSLQDRIKGLIEAGATSFKIEGRLKNISYVRNIVRSYSDILDDIIGNGDGRYVRSSWGTPSGGFTPHPEATFNRGYTRYFIDGQRGQWCSGDYAKGMGEPVGKVSKRLSAYSFELIPRPGLSTPLSNGDGLCLITRGGETVGMRADTIHGNTVTCSQAADIRTGATIYRNFNRGFEKTLESNPPVRLIPATVRLRKSGENRYTLTATASGSGVTASLDFEAEPALNRDKASSGLQASLSKRSGIFSFSLTGMPSDHQLPFLPASTANALRRELARQLEPSPVPPDMTPTVPFDLIDRSRIVPPAQRHQLNCANSLSRSIYRAAGFEPGTAFELDLSIQVELMRCKYCIRYETGRCPRTNHKEKATPLYLINNGRRLKAIFDCAHCEMVILPDSDTDPGSG
ncbi:MAG TPA: U32 family peptidase [Candidatus Coprenecus pullistercoris]|nr:U32 family peptidase [Candidatus Coprenecus pullistercoris]